MSQLRDEVMDPHFDVVTGKLRERDDTMMEV